MAPLLIRKPRFVLPEVLALNPDLPHDDDPDAYWREQEATIEAKVRAEYGLKYRNGYSIETATDPAHLERALRDTGVYPSSSEYLNDLMVKVFAKRLGDEATERENERRRRETSEDGWVKVPAVDYENELAQINRVLDEREASQADHGIVSPPGNANPLLRIEDVILLDPSGDMDATVHKYFAVHKTLLAAESLAFFVHARNHKAIKVFNVDANLDTLALFVSWLYRCDHDLTRFSTNQLLSLLCIALDICIPALHDAVIKVLMHRHQSSATSISQPVTFAPGKEDLCRVYEKSKRSDGARWCMSYLLALWRDVEEAYNAGMGWERRVRLDASQWEAKEDMLGHWEKMPAKAFFMVSSWRRDTCTERGYDDGGRRLISGVQGWPDDE